MKLTAGQTPSGTKQDRQRSASRPAAAKPGSRRSVAAPPSALDTRRYYGPTSSLDDHDGVHRQHRVPQLHRLTGSRDEEDEEEAKPGALQAILLLNLGALLFATNQVLVKYAGEADNGLSASDLGALRFAIAAACFAPKALRGLRNNPQAIKPALELGFWLFGGYLSQAYGLTITSAAHGAITGTFTVLVVPMLVGLSGRKIAKSTWVAAGVALLGVTLLTAGEGDFNSGDALCILSALLFGVHKWRSESITARFSECTQELVGMQLAVLALFTCAVALPPHLGDWAQQSVGTLLHEARDLPWLQVIYMGLVSTAVTLAIEMHALKSVSAPVAALIYTSEPVWGALLAWVLLGERWGEAGWVGAALIIAASLSAQLKGAKKKKGPRARTA